MMVVYFIMLGIPALLSILISVFKRYKFKDSNRIIIDSFFLIWIFILMFRSEMLGIDLPVYRYHFVNFSQMSWNELISRIFQGEFEVSFSTISKIVSSFTEDFHWVLIVCAAISVIPIWSFYRTNARHGYLTVVLFVNIAPFAMYFSGLRQVIAMALVVPCYYYCRDKKIGSYLTTVFLASLCHNSAVILLLLYPIYHMRLKKAIHLLYLIPIIGGVYVLKLPIFNILLSFIGTKYYERYSEGIKATGAYAVLALLIVFLIYSYLIVDVKKLDEDTIGLRNILLLCTILQVFAGVHTVSMRMNYYFLLFVPVLMARIVDKGKKKYKILTQLSLLCMVCFFAVYYFYRIYSGSDELNIYPYISLFADY